jgi:tRNA(Ile)-lysidine synthase
MHSLQKQFHEFVKDEELLNESDHVLLAVSGGLDSIVLADLFLNSKWKFGVAHCNFQLRAKESDEDEAYVDSWATQNNRPFHIKHFDLGEGSVQLNARNARYSWFDELAVTYEYSKIAVAHHLNDALETVLINLSRGTGIKGLAGIQPKTEKIIRPLLFATKNQLIEYASENSLQWREDSSNAKSDYDRNLIRHEVIPILQKLNPALLETYRNTFERVQLSNHIIQKKVVEVKSKHLLEKDDLLELGLSWVIEKVDLLVLSELLSEYGFNYSTSKEVYEALGKPGKKFFSNDFILTMDRTSLFIQTNSTKDETELSLDGPGEFNYGSETFSVVERTNENIIFGQAFTAYLDADKIKFPLTIRKWREGDHFVPLGMGGSKKISDLLIDRKIPVALKPNVLVLVSNGEIIWVIEHQLSDRVKLTDTTEKVLEITLSH